MSHPGRGETGSQDTAIDDEFRTSTVIAWTEAVWADVGGEGLQSSKNPARTNYKGDAQ